MVLRKISNIKMLQPMKTFKSMITIDLIFTQISLSHLEVTIMNRVILMIIIIRNRNNNRMNSDMIMDSILLRATITIILSRKTMAYDEGLGYSQFREGRLRYGFDYLELEMMYLILFSLVLKSLFIFVAFLLTSSTQNILELVSIS